MPPQFTIGKPPLSTPERIKRASPSFVTAKKPFRLHAGQPALPFPIFHAMNVRHLARFAVVALTLLTLSPLSLQPGHAQESAPTPSTDSTAPSIMKDIRIILKTDKGNIELTLFPAKAPVTCASFLNLAAKGKYDGVTFHRVIANFMIQGGDPTGTGRGDRGYKFEDECTPELKFDRPGRLAMANAGPGTNGSQFFITHVPTDWLNGKHTIFGQVTQGQDVVNAVKQGDAIKGIEILDSTEELFTAQAGRIAKFNAAMN
jgi:peptidyl-prolyl cis-trans isomerase B (cyclophilin B)